MSSINRHFRREAKLTLLLPLFLIAVALVAAILLPPILAHQEATKCQAAGGKYDESTEVCKLASPK